jgi:hypothetical protein
VVDDAAEAIDERLGDVADDGEAADHVTVEGAVADGDFAFIAGREDESVPLVGQGHQSEAAEAGLDVLLGGIGGRAGEQRGETGGNGAAGFGNGGGFAADTEVICEGVGVFEGVIGGVGAGHGDAGDVLGADGIGGDAGDEGGIDAAAEADEGLAETAFAHVVTGAEHKGIVHGGSFVLMTWAAAPVPVAGVEQDQVLGEGRGFGGDGAVGEGGEGGAVEDELVIAAGHIDVEVGDAVATSHGGEHLAAEVTFAHVIGRAVDGDDEGCALADELFDWVFLVPGAVQNCLSFQASSQIVMARGRPWKVQRDCWAAGSKLRDSSKTS